MVLPYANANNNINNITINEMIHFFDMIDNYAHSLENEDNVIMNNIYELFNNFQYRIENYNGNDNRIVKKINDFNRMKQRILQNIPINLKIASIQDFFLDYEV